MCVCVRVCVCVCVRLCVLCVCMCSWVHDMYHTSFREPLYKGGRVKERVPGCVRGALGVLQLVTPPLPFPPPLPAFSWCDRIQYHSLRHLRGDLRPMCVACAAPQPAASAERAAALQVREDRGGRRWCLGL